MKAKPSPAKKVAFAFGRSIRWVRRASAVMDDRPFTPLGFELSRPIESPLRLKDLGGVYR